MPYIQVLAALLQAGELKLDLLTAEWRNRDGRILTSIEVEALVRKALDELAALDGETTCAG